MNIVKLTAENVKRLRAIEIEPDGNVVVVAGRNGQGKTSVLDSVSFALGGAAAMKGTTKPIREGEDEAFVTLDLGDFTVTRKWTEDSTTLSVMSKDGAKYQSPQKFLDEKLGALSFDPLAFSQQDEKTQLKTLLELVKLPFDLDEMAARRLGFYTQRTEVGREVKSLEAQLHALEAVPEDTPEEEISSASILDAQEAYNAEVRAYQDVQRAVFEGENLVSLINEEVERLERMLDEKKQFLQKNIDGLAKLRGTLESSPAPTDRDFRGALAGVENVNAAVRLRRERERLGTELGQAKIKQNDLTKKIDDIDLTKSQALAEANMPVPGLAFNDEGVTYNGVPFKQSSSAEQLRVSIAMAMAMNPTIRVIRISDGSLLDSTNMAVIAEMADEHDFQVWIERVDESGTVGFIIEDGSLADPNF